MKPNESRNFCEPHGSKGIWRRKALKMIRSKAASVPSARLAGEAGGSRKREKLDVHGWLILDKPVGITSTQAVAIVKRLFAARRAGHAGTLDPLASGCLPIALGEATKTVSFVMNGRKIYQFVVRWGEERDT